MKKTYIVLFLAAVTSLTSCLKDGKVNFAPGASPMTVQWTTTGIGDAPKNSQANIYRLYGRSFAAVPSFTMNLQVGLTGTDPATEDITLTLNTNTAAYAAYVGTAAYAINTGTPAYGATGYVEANNPNPILPAAFFTMPTTVTIAKGTRVATVPVVIKSDQFDLRKTYWLPVRIASTTKGEVAANYGTVIYLLNGQNAYDADYTTTGFLFHPTAGSERAINRTQHFFSSGVNTSYKEFGDLGASGYQYQFDINGATLANYVPLGATPALPASGFMTADNPGNIAYNGAGADRPGTAPWVQSTYNNTYNAGTKTFFLHVGYHVGGNGQNTFTRQVYEKSVRK